MNASQAYFVAQIESATPLQRLILLYDGAVRFLENAILQMERGDASAATLSNIRAQNIVLELRNVLDFQRGGEIAPQLHRVYSAWLMRLVEGNRKRDASILRQVKHQVENMRGAWVTLEERGASAAEPVEVAGVR